MPADARPPAAAPSRPAGRPTVADWFHATVSGERRGLGPSLTRALLRGASQGYALGLTARDLTYRCGLVRPLQVDARVISVGNLTLGGTGKTPAVMHLAKRFHDAGERVAILIRGHGGERLSGVNVVHDGVNRLLGVAEVGDEPVLLAERLREVPVLVGKDRRLTASYAVERFDATVLLLDDGFQYRKLAVDDQIVLLDATQPFGNGRLFPAGVLRDPPSYLARADQVWLTRTDHPAALPAEQVRAEVARHAPQVPVYRTRHLPARLWQFPSGQPLELAQLRQRRVMAMAGIGNPGAFFATLDEMQPAAVIQEPFPDHHRFERDEITAVRQRAVASGCDAVVTTEKDAVRLELWPAGGPELWVLGIELVFDGAAPTFEAGGPDEPAK
ncbi:MAG: tetraacyldisaccharide 4'-kinase [Fimbriimonadaceae bacterium]|nr:tetraacyldisaccharide 4'-kinase [Fimbriimonadaceae bacterium]